MRLLCNPAFYGFGAVLALIYWSTSLLGLTGPPAFIQRVPSLRETDRATSPREAAANRTLGFQAILALSTQPGWRTRGLQAAAALSGLDIEIWQPAPVSDERAQAFAALGDGEHGVVRPSLAAAKTWLAHLALLEHVLERGYATALIVEDDADWDVALAAQTRLVSDAVRVFTAAPANDTRPYGAAWDVLWLGHCGEHTDADTRHVEYPDPTVPRHARYAGWSQKYLAHLYEGHRLVQHAINPVCATAYAVTAAGARAVRAWADHGRNEAFDIRLMEGCRAHALTAVSVQPELMHRYTPPPEARAADADEGAEREAPWERTMGRTDNILQSARCQALFRSTCGKDDRDWP